MNKNKANRKIQGMPQSQTAANPRHQEEEKKDKKHTRAKQTNKCTRSTKTTHSRFPKRGDQHAKTNEKNEDKEHEKTVRH